MKNIIILGLLVLLVPTACTDLEEEPLGLLAPEGFFKTPADVEATIFGALDRMASERVWGRKLVASLQLRSDMVDIGDRGTAGRRIQVNDFNMDAGNGMVSSFWPNMYRAISSVNAAIAGLQQISASENRKLALEAEARFFRSFNYYHLVRLFGDIPYIDEFITDPESVISISKTSESEVYQNIISDLIFAKQNLPDNYPGDVRSRPTAGSAATMLASVYLTLGDYQQAATEAEWVINNRDRFGYDLEPDFQDLFDATKTGRATPSREHIFVFEFLGQQRATGGANFDFMAPMTGVRGSDHRGFSVCVPSMAVYDTWDDRDYRKKVSFEDTTLINGVPSPYTEFPVTQRPHIAKYFRFAGTANADRRLSDHNYAAFRYAEVLLIAAEALNESNGAPTAQALDYINQVRARARNYAGVQTDFPADLGNMSQEAFRNAVMEERRIELAFEYKRWYDIKRRDMLLEVFTGPESLEPQEVDPNRDYLFPLPQDELMRNENLLPQNPGY